MPDRIGQVLLVDVATLRRPVTAHAVTDTGNAAMSNLELGEVTTSQSLGLYLCVLKLQRRNLTRLKSVLQ